MGTLIGHQGEQRMQLYNSDLPSVQYLSQCIS